MAVSSVELVPYTHRRRLSSQLADEIMRCLAAAPGSLRVEFPEVISRYSSSRQARDSVDAARRAMQDVRCGFGAYTIEVSGTVVGVASYSQQTIAVSEKDGAVKVVEGPLIAAWMAEPSVCGRPHHVLPTLLECGAESLLANNVLFGTPWTVVNTTNTYVTDVLTNTQALGGFVPAGKAGTFARLDGSPAMRQLFVSASKLQDLR